MYKLLFSVSLGIAVEDSVSDWQHLKEEVTKDD